MFFMVDKKYIPIIAIGCAFWFVVFLLIITGSNTVPTENVVTAATTKAEISTAAPTVAHTHNFVEVERTPNFSLKETTIKKECSCGRTEVDIVDISTEELSEYLKANCKAYTYEEIARTPDKYKGELAVFTGEVIQVQETWGTTILRVNITKEGDEYFSYYTDTVYVDYEFTDELKILENDIITMYGELQGEQSYKTVLGQYVTIPSVEVYYAELNKN